MKLINRENGDELVEVGAHDKYASKGVAGAGLGLGIAGTALWLLNGGLGNGLLGGFGPGWNRGCGYGAGASVALAEGAINNEKIWELTNGMWQLAYNGAMARQQARETNIAELFALYKSQVDGDFNNYKFSRDSFDITANRISDLEKKVAVLEATRPYQDALIKCDIERHADWAKFDLYRRTCRMIEGQVVLPNTPTITGFGSYSRCGNNTTTESQG